MTEIDQGPPPSTTPPTDPYADAVRQIVTPPAQPAAEPADPYQAAVGQVVSARKAVLSSSLVKGMQEPPDRQAKVVALADKLGLPPDVVSQNYDDLTKRDAVQGIDNQALLKDHPGLAKWLVQPGNAGLAQGDMPQLQHMDSMAQSLDGVYNPGGILPPGYMFTPDGKGEIRGPLHEDGTPPVIYKGIDDLKIALQGQVLAGQEQQRQFQAHLQASSEAGGLPAHLEAGLQGSIGSTTAAVLSAANWYSRLFGGQGDLTVGGLNPTQFREFSEEGLAASAQDAPGASGSLQRLTGGLIGDIPLYAAGGGIGELAKVGPTLGEIRAVAKLYGAGGWAPAPADSWMWFQRCE